MDDDATKWQELSVKKLFKIGFKVKDCPFCGSSDIHANHAPETSTAYMVCMSCYSTGPMQTSLAAAVDKWNYPMQIRATFTGKEWVCDTGEVMARA